MPRADTPDWLDRLFSDRWLRTAALLTVVLAVLPPDGAFSVPLCPVLFTTGGPCPGCGLTRCGSHLLRGHVGRAAAFNPFGLVFLPALFALAGLAVVPAPWREAVRRGLRSHERALHRGLVVFTVAFGLFGVWRWLGVWAGWFVFPPP